MIETENKVYARRCESHVEALRRAVPGCIEKVEWQCEDQLTITVKQDKLPEAVHYLYYERYGWIPVIIGNDERSLCGRYAVYYVISMEGEDPGWVTVRAEVDPAKCRGCRKCVEVCPRGVLKMEPLNYPVRRVCSAMEKGKAVRDACSAGCISCGKCALSCPVNGIDIVGRKPHWNGACTHCMACICGCPVSAIEYGHKSQGKPRYQCPEYK